MEKLHQLQSKEEEDLKSDELKLMGLAKLIAANDADLLGQRMQEIEINDQISVPSKGSKYISVLTQGSFLLVIAGQKGKCKAFMTLLENGAKIDGHVLLAVF
jgi:hypothetical protein